MIVQLLEVLIGLVLVYLVFSTVASSLVETVEMWLQKRGKFLETGIQEILAAVSGRKSSENDLKLFYDSPFISSLFRGGYEPGSKMLPSYIPAERFVDALLQLAREKDSTFEVFVKRMKDATGPESEDVDALRAQCSRYFNESMERVSGWYQRHTRSWLMGIAFVIAVVANVDTIQLMRTLSQDETLRERVVEAATLPSGEPSTLDRAETHEQLQLLGSLGLPIGWNQAELCTVFGVYCPESEPGNETGDDETGLVLAMLPLLSKLVGVLLTTFALSFGAPFWFDLLNELVNLRTSLKPKGNEPDRTMAPPSEEPGEPAGQPQGAG